MSVHKIRESVQHDRMVAQEQVAQLSRELSTANDQARRATEECEQSRRLLDEVLSQRLRDAVRVAPTASERKEARTVEVKAAAAVRNCVIQTLSVVKMWEYYNI